MKDTHTTAREYAEGKICEAFGIEAEHITMQIGKIPKFSGKDLLEAHEAGAIGALAGQWRKDTDTEGLKDGDQVIVALQRVDNSIKYFYAAYFQNGKFWYESDDSEVRLFNIWMMLPEPPKD